jgi:hypothetical protein
MGPRKPLSSRELKHMIDAAYARATDAVTASDEIKGDKRTLMDRPAIKLFKSMNLADFGALTATDRNKLIFRLLKNLIHEAVTDE